MSTPLRREVPMFRPCREPSLDDAMADPLIQALMLADGVDPDELRALMRGAAAGSSSALTDRNRSACELPPPPIGTEALGAIGTRAPLAAQHRFPRPRSPMVNFFIERPIFAASVAIIMVLAGLICYPLLPVAQFPEVTPPLVVVSATYPGASAQVVADTVTTPLEQQINGVPGMIYMSSTSANDRSSNFTVSFDV